MLGFLLVALWGCGAGDVLDTAAAADDKALAHVSASCGDTFTRDQCEAVCDDGEVGPIIQCHEICIQVVGTPPATSGCFFLRGWCDAHLDSTRYAPWCAKLEEAFDCQQCAGTTVAE